MWILWFLIGGVFILNIKEEMQTLQVIHILDDESIVRKQFNDHSLKICF
jgi:hypothetical protein